MPTVVPADVAQMTMPSAFLAVSAPPAVRQLSPWRIGSPGYASVAVAVGVAAWLLVLLAVAELLRMRGQRRAELARSREEQLAQTTRSWYEPDSPRYLEPRTTC